MGPGSKEVGLRPPPLLPPTNSPSHSPTLTPFPLPNFSFSSLPLLLPLFSPFPSHSSIFPSTIFLSSPLFSTTTSSSMLIQSEGLGYGDRKWTVAANNSDPPKEPVARWVAGSGHAPADSFSVGCSALVGVV